MGRTKRTRDPTEEYRPIDPASREQQMIGLAVNLAEDRLRKGTATSQIIEHYLKLASTQAQMQLRLMEAEIKLKEAKAAGIEADQRTEERYQAAIEAMRRYNGDEM